MRSDLWRRTALAVSVLIATQMMVALLWRAEAWPGRAAALALVTGFGITLGVRFAARLSFRGHQMMGSVAIGAVTSVLFFALFTSAIN